VVPSGPGTSAPGLVSGPAVAEEDEEGATMEDEEEEDMESSEEEGYMEEFHDSQLPMKVLPLYSLLSSAQQRKVCVHVPVGLVIQRLS